MSGIMLIDQDETRLQALMSALKTSHVEMVPASDGMAAWRAIQVSPPKLVICSAVPAPDDSLLLCRRIKLGGRQIPFVAYTPAEDEVLRLRFLESGADDFVTADALTSLLAGMAPEQTDKPLVLKKPEASQPEKAAPAPTQQQMFFRLKSGELGNVLQFLGFSSRTGRLEVSLDGKSREKATIGIEKGEVVHAAFDGVVGIDALAMLLIRGDAEAYFFESAEIPGHELSMPLSQLLIEATVLADENRDALQACANEALLPTRLLEELPKDCLGDADVEFVWPFIDGTGSIKELVAELQMREQRVKHVLKKLLDTKAIQLQDPETATIAPWQRAEGLFRRVCLHLQEMEDEEARKRLLAHLTSLARRENKPEDYLNVVMLNYPSTLKITHATCRCDCGAQAFLVDGGSVECSKCGTPMVVRSSATYHLKSDSIAREQTTH